MKRLITFILATICTIIALAQNGISTPDLIFDLLDNNDGLPSNYIRRIHKDREGFLWFSTDVGVVRYDGYEFKTFRKSIHSNLEFKSNYITIITDDEYYLWIGTNNGLIVLDKKTGVFKPIKWEGMDNTTISDILSIEDQIWVGTNKGLFRCTYDGDVFSSEIMRLNDRTHMTIKDLFQDSNGRLWIAAAKEGVFRFDFKEGKAIHYPDGKYNRSAHIFFEGHDNTLWIGTFGHGLVKMYNCGNPDNVYYEYFQHDKDDKASIGSDIIYSMERDRYTDDLWIGHRNGLSIMRHGSKSNHFDNYISDGKDRHLADNDISDLFLDERGTMWLATFGGINKIMLRQPEFTSIPFRKIMDKHHTSNVTALYKDKMGNIWAGLRNNGLVIINPDGKSFCHSSEIPNLKGLSPTSKILSFLEVNDGNQLMMTTEGNGLIVVDLKEGIPVSTKEYSIKSNKSLQLDNFPFSTFQDMNGDIWIGRMENISIYTHDMTPKVLDVLPHGVSGNVLNIAEESDGTIWAGTKQKGIIRIYKQGNEYDYETYDVSNGKLNNNEVKALFIDSKDNIWTGTLGGGLSRFDHNANTFIPMNESLKIPFKDIFNITDDFHGNLWGTSHDSIFKIGQDDVIEIYRTDETPEHHMLSTECKLCKLDENRFALGTSQGMIIINPENMRPESYQHKAEITDIKVNYKSIFTTRMSGQDMYADGKLKLKKKDNNFSIEFSSLNFSDISKSRYSYRLEGYDATWNELDNGQHIASYTNIPKGKYHLKVATRNDYGQWSQPIDILDIIVKPGIFEAWYSYVIYVVLALTCIWEFRRITWNRIKMREELQRSKLEKEKNEEIARSKMKFFTNISHEFLTPLTIIGCSVENIEGQNEQETTNIHIIRNNVKRLHNLIREVLEFNKAESGSLKLKVSDINISEFIQAICDNDFKLLAQKQNIVLSTDILPSIRGWIDADKIDKVVTNLLSNAFKYNYENSYVHLSMVEDYDENTRYAIIKVKDGGVGMAQDELEKIYERFYENDFRDIRKEGTGIGLALTKSLVELHKGNISVISTKGAGSEFTVKIPINEGSYTKEEKITPMLNDIYALQTEANEGNGKRILIVENNEELRFEMRQYLSRYFVVEEAGNGKEAIKELELTYYDLVITDLMMPVMNGEELCRYIKGKLDYSEIPVLMLTAKTSDEAQISCYESGADAYMTKPFQMPTLISRINNLLKGRELMKRNYAQGKDTIQIKTLSFSSLDEKFLDDAIAVVEKNISNEEFCLDNFAEQMNVSKATFYRKIKTLTGMSGSEFIKDIRLKQACMLMKDKELNISEISYMVGFGQPNYFTYCFKKKYGMTPTEYIEKIKSDGTEADARTHEAN